MVSLEIKIELPKEEYRQVQENGKTVIYCTMRQKVLHVVGLDYQRPYTRHGKKFYRPYRNSWGGRDADLDKLVESGLMDAYPSERTGERYWYSFNRSGLDWLGEQIGVKILDEE